MSGSCAFIFVYSFLLLQCDAEHENLARAIFDELNDAYSRFEESGAQPLY